MHKTTPMSVGFYAGLVWVLCVESILLEDPCKFVEDGARLAHPSQCDHFIICIDQMIKSAGKCPTGLHFNRRLGVCDLANRAECFIATELKKMESMSGESEYSCDCCSYCHCCDAVPCPETPSTSAPAALTNSSSCWTPTNCNKKGVCENQPDGAMFPDPASSGYIVCQCECEILMPCPSGLIFNPKLNVCDWPEIINTKTTTPVTPGTPNRSPTSVTSTTHFATSTTDTFSGTSTTSVMSTDSTSIARDASSLPTTFDLSTTTKYATSTPFESSATDISTTASNTSTTDASPFSASTTLGPYSSSPPLEVNTTTDLGYIITSTRSDFSSPDTSTDSSGKSTAAPSSMSTGSRSTPLVASTPATTSKPSNPSEGPSGTTCNKKGVCENQPDGTMFPFPGSKGYIVCQCECEIPMGCPSGLVFNPLLNVCDWPKETTGSGANMPPVSAPAPSAPSIGPSGTTCNKKGVCENQPNGTMFPDFDSNGYIVCQCECEVPMPCPNGLVFNPDVAVCDWPQTFP